MSDSLLDTGHDLSFEELAKLREHLRQILETATASLRVFHSEASGGFVHKVTPGQPPNKWSKSSTATCLSFLESIGELNPAGKGGSEGQWAGEARLVSQILADEKWASAGLPDDNPFTASFLLEALHDLGGATPLDAEQRKKVGGKLKILRKKVLKGDEPGGVSLQKYAATSFLTYKAVAALDRWRKLRSDADLTRAVSSWVWAHLSKESVLVAFSSPDADVFEVAYSVLVASKVTKFDNMTPQQRFLLGKALDQFFEAQRKEDGGWPRSRPLFVYPDYGHAYCFDYELLASMLADRQLRPHMYQRLGNLRLAAEGLAERKYPLEPSEGGQKDVAYGWASGHHGADPRPESWSTASALHFCFSLNALVADAIRRATFEDVGVEYRPPTEPAGKPDLPDDFLDSRIQCEDGSAPSLKRTMKERFLKPLLEDRKRLEYGKSLRPAPVTPSAAILYGPPGTSKTKLSEIVSEVLGWPLLRLDPSHLTRRGLDQAHAEADRLFGRLQQCECLVILLDEFDELMRDREDGELENRFLTTAMLPKLATLSEERRVVYLVATNHLERFDAAIRRPGRFDLVIPVMPPTIKAKREKWAALDDGLAQVESLGGEDAEEAAAALSDLTFAEAEELAGQVKHMSKSWSKPSDAHAKKLSAAFIAAGSRCTVRQQVASDSDSVGDGTWKAELSSLRHRIRLGRPS